MIKWVGSIIDYVRINVGESPTVFRDMAFGIHKSPANEGFSEVIWSVESLSHRDTGIRGFIGDGKLVAGSSCIRLESRAIHPDPKSRGSHEKKMCMDV